MPIEVLVDSVHLHIQRMQDMRSPIQVEVAMCVDKVGIAVELGIGILPIGEPPTGVSGPYKGFGSGF